jgi:hypothetical protein
MSKTRIVILIGLLLVIVTLAIFLWPGTESRFGDFIFDNPVTPPLLFFIFFGALAGVIKIFVDATLTNRMSRAESGVWERRRAKGKLGYILNALLFCGLPIIAMLAIQVTDTELTSYIVRNFVVVGLVLIGGIAAIAASLWNYQEAMYLKVKESDSGKSEDVGDVTKAE